MTTNISTPNNPRPAGVSGQPSEAQLRAVPAAVAGASGASPQPLITPPASGSAESLYYFLDSAQTTSPQVLPVLNLAPPGFEPPLGFTIPSAATAADPRSLPGRTAAPGQHLGSTAPATPGVELGAQPFVPRVPPASAFGAPTEEPLRGAPAAVAGASGVSPQPLVTPPGSGSAEALYYFLESVPPTSPRTVPALNFESIDVSLGSVPNLGLAPSPASPPAVGTTVTPPPSPPAIPRGSLYFLDEVWKSAGTPPAPEPKSIGFRPEVVPGTASSSDSC